MSTPHEYAAPLAAAQALMAEQMAKPANIAKLHWRNTTVATLFDAMLDNVDKLLMTRNDNEARLSAANIANFAWMLADHRFPKSVEHGAGTGTYCSSKEHWGNH